MKYLFQEEPERTDRVEVAVYEAIREGLQRQTHWRVPDHIVEKIRDDVWSLEHLMRCAVRIKDYDMFEKSEEKIKEYAEGYPLEERN